MGQCVAYIYNPDTTLTFELKVKFIGILTWPRIWATAFLSFDILSYECITMGRCVTLIHDLCMALTFGPNIKIFIFTMNLCLGMIVFALWQAYQIWHLGVSPCVHSRPLYDLYIWSTCGVAGCILSEFCSQFLSWSFFLVCCCLHLLFYMMLETGRCTGHADKDHKETPS